MANLADDIEAYLLAMLTTNGTGQLSLQRVEVARVFACAPSQVTYVLATRFTPQRGFLVESRRGGGGFIRIVRLMSPLRLLRAILEATEGGIDGASASCYADWLQREGLLSAREASLLRAASARETLGVPLPERDRLRARLFRAMVLALFAGPSEAASDGVEDPRQ